MKTAHAIEYCTEPYGHIATIPAGTKLEPAANLPQGGFWAKPWRGMTQAERAWHRSYGFHVSADDAI